MNQSFIASLETLIKYYSNDKLSNIILDLQKQVINKDIGSVKSIVSKEYLSESTLGAALEVKEVMGQINVVVHTLGILNALPYILKDGEVIESVSLGADNASSEFDLITNMRIAEFKFITWRGNDSMRLKTTFADYYNLAEVETDKERYLYLVDCSYFEKFLNGRRSISSILNRNTKILNDFEQKYKDRYRYINEYYNDNKLKVRLVSLKEIIPNIYK